MADRHLDLRLVRDNLGHVSLITTSLYLARQGKVIEVFARAFLLKTNWGAVKP